MKKLAVFLAVILLGVGGLAIAGASKAELKWFPGGGKWAPGEYPGASGFVVVNHVEEEGVTILNVQCRGLAPDTVYGIFSGAVHYGDLTTNGKGHGHLNVKFTGALAGGRVNIYRGSLGVKLNLSLRTDRL